MTTSCPDCGHDDERHTGVKFLGCIGSGCPCPRPPRRDREDAAGEKLRETCPDCGAQLLRRHEWCDVCSWSKPLSRRVSSKRSREEIAKSIARSLSLDASGYHPWSDASQFLLSVRLRTAKLPKGVSFHEDAPTAGATIALANAIRKLSDLTDLQDEVKHRNDILQHREEPDEREKSRIGEFFSDSPAARDQKRAIHVGLAQGELETKRRLFAHLLSVLVLGRTTCDAPGPHGATCDEDAGHLSAKHGGWATIAPIDTTVRFPSQPYLEWITCTFPVGDCCRKHKEGAPDECLSWAVYNGRAGPPVEAPRTHRPALVEGSN